MNSRNVRHIFYLFVAFGVLFSISASAGLLDDTDELKGQYILDVGTLESLDCPADGKYDCRTWPDDLYEFNSTKCFQVIGYYGTLARVVLLAIDKSKKVTIFVLPYLLGSSVKQYSTKSYNCPD